MSSLVYLYQRTIVNKIKKALKRPMTYIAVVFIALYLVMVLWAFGMMADDFGLVDANSLAGILSILVFWVMPGDIISYSRRRGLIFRPAEVHFVFPSPENPKKMLIAASIKNYLIMTLFGFFATLFGIFFFEIEPWRMLLFFLFFAVLENILEGSMIIICYGNQTLPKAFFKVLTVVLIVLMAVMTGIAVFLLCTKGTSFSVISEYLTHPVVQAVPVIGWAIAFIHLLLVGPTTVNVICTVCYVLTALLLFVYAWKMECTGEYYEDAMKFAEEYDLKRKKAKKGEMVIGSKKKYIKGASVQYKGVYGKAIYYRQLLEYKKNRFFIFGWNTLLYLGLGIVIALIAYFTDLTEEFAEGKVFIIPAVYAYMMFIFSGYATKWSKELENPYTYLIPDSGVKKLWYSTKIEHIRAIVDGCFVTLPGAIVMQLEPVSIALIILTYVCLNANKLYMNMLADALLGNLLGSVGKSLFRIFLQGIVLAAAVVMAAVFGIFISINAGFLAMCLMMLALTGGVAVAASCAFERMETLE